MERKLSCSHAKKNIVLIVPHDDPQIYAGFIQDFIYPCSILLLLASTYLKNCTYVPPPKKGKQAAGA